MAMCSVLIKGDVFISGNGILLWRDCTQCIIIICIIMTYKFIIILFRLLAPSHPAAGFSSQSYNNNNNKYMYMYV